MSLVMGDWPQNPDDICGQGWALSVIMDVLVAYPFLGRAKINYPTFAPFVAWLRKRTGSTPWT